MNRHTKRFSDRLKSAGATAFFLVCLLAVGSEGHPAAGDGRSLTGRLLVASPELRDSNFARAVIYMVSHDAEGAIGFVINRPLAQGPISDLLRGFGVEGEKSRKEVVLHYGGPVEPDLGFVVHTVDYQHETTQVVGGGVGVTPSVDVLRAIALGKGPRQSLILMGYAGWGPGQLEAEIKSDAWFSIPAEKGLIFEEDPEAKWQRANDKRGVPL